MRSQRKATIPLIGRKPTNGTGSPREPTSKSFILAPHFHNEEAAYDFIEARLWPSGPICPHCGNSNPERVYSLRGKTTRMGLRKCGECKKPFNVKLGTVFEDSHCPLYVWLQAIQVMYSSKQYVSILRLRNAISIGKHTAEHLTRCIREIQSGDDNVTSTLANDGHKGAEFDRRRQERRTRQTLALRSDNPARAQKFFEMAVQLGADHNDALEKALGVIAAKRSTPKHRKAARPLPPDIPLPRENEVQKTELVPPQPSTTPELDSGPEASHHLESMKTPHHPRDTIYRVVEQRGPTYAVEILKPRVPPTMMCGFRTEAEAEAWINLQKLKADQSWKG